MFSYVSSKGIKEYQKQYFASVSPSFYAAAWDLCRQGILRPGIIHYNMNLAPDGCAGNGYSITPFGQV